jgi:hypothetical protein
MAGFVLFVAWDFRDKSTGLRWDPVTIADYCALFAHCNVAEYFAPLEMEHNKSAQAVMADDQHFRLGYWHGKLRGSNETKLVYGIGTTWRREGMSRLLRTILD